MELGPKKIELSEIGLNAAGALVAGIAGGVSIFIIIYILGDLIDISGDSVNRGIKQAGSPLFPLLLSVVTLIGSSISSFLTMKIFSLTSPERYKQNSVISRQIGFFILFLYVLITPVYIWTGFIDYTNTMMVFLVHVLLLKFGISLILETMNNYRYVMIGIYGSFIGLMIAGICTVGIFSSFESGVARLISLVILIPIINVTMTLAKQLFELAYYKYYSYSGIDSLGDIFARIEQEEEEILREAEQENSI